MIIQKIRRLYWIICNCLILWQKKVLYGSNLRINGKIFISGKKRAVSIGDNVIINTDKRYNPIGGDIRTVFYTIGDGKIRIGNNVGISNSALVARDEINIEDNVLIGGGCRIYDNDFHSVHYQNRTNDIDVKSEKILIREGAFIGAGSIILKGVVVGKHSVIGAGSVVTRNIPDNQIWGGNPAKFIRNIG